MIKPHQKEALVLGLGQSGLAAARLLSGRSWSVTAVDESLGARMGVGSAALADRGVFLSTGEYGVPHGNFAFAVISPGIPMNHPWAVECRSRGIPIVSELELGWFFCPGKILAVTGSNGKTTLVEFLKEALKQAGHSVCTAGNIGIPLSTVVMEEPPFDWYVVEVSSFQLEYSYEFRPGIGVLLNIHPNHLDRHGSFEAYRQTKCKLFQSMEREDTAIVPFPLLDQVKGSSSRNSDPDWVTIGTHQEAASYRYDTGQIFKEGHPYLNVRGTYFDHPIYGENLAAGIAALDSVGISRLVVRETLRGFHGLQHRFECIAEVQGVQCINDSKATNLRATAGALKSCTGPVHLIAGGVLKEDDLNSLKEILVQKAHTVYLIGSAATRMLEAWSPAVTCWVCNTLEHAVDAAWERAEDGDTILLSPGCASFDQFNGYEERGDRFKELITSRTVEATS